MSEETKPASRFIKAHGLWFHYLEWEAEGPVAVLGHAAGFCAGLWSPLAHSLHQRGYRVVSIDLRGHGDTEAARAADYSWNTLGKDMAEILDRLNLEDVLAIGHSAGAAALMLGEALSPGRTRYGFHMEPAIVFRPWQPSELKNGLDSLSLGAMKRRTTWESREQLFQAYREKPTFKSWREEYLQAYVEGGTRELPDGTVELKCSPEVEVRLYRNALKSHPDVWEALHTYKPPTAVLLSHPHPLIPAESKELQRLRLMVPSVRIKPVEGVSHYFPMEQPEEFEKLLWEFVEEVEKEEAERAAMAQLVVARPAEWPTQVAPLPEETA